MSLSFASFGECNPDKRFYVIWRAGGGAGFFSNFFHVLGHIVLAERLGMIPVVDMENFKTFYQEENIIENTRNVWEYCYEQPAIFSLPEVYKSKNVFFCSGQFNHEIYNSMPLATETAQKYLRLKPSLADKFHVYKEKLFGENRILGVHFRGTDMRTAPEHPIPPTVEQIKNAIEKAWATKKFDRIFVATEDQNNLNALLQEYGEKIIYINDVFRTNLDTPFEWGDASALPRYHAAMGVLLDAYLLSHVDCLIASGCDGIASGSNVTRAAQVLAAIVRKEQKYDLIFNGYNPREKTRKAKKSFLTKLCCSIKKRLA